MPVLASSDDPRDHDELVLYADALASDPVKCTRDIVADCRVSGQRRAELRKVIVSGNEHKSWDMDILQLLRDCDTRWSSTKNMITRLIYLYPVC